MTDVERDDEAFLASHLRELPRSIEPPADLWPGVERRLAPRVRPRWTGPWLRLAAAVLLVALSSGVTWFLVRRAPPPVVVAAPPVDPAMLARLARAGDVLEEGLASANLAPSTRVILLRNLAVIDSAVAECQRALDADPGSRVLAGLLRTAQRQRVEFLQQAARLSRT
jgi:hypothetical protein